MAEARFIPECAGRRDVAFPTSPYGTAHSAPWCGISDRLVAQNPFLTRPAPDLKRLVLYRAIMNGVAEAIILQSIPARLKNPPQRAMQYPNPMGASAA